MVSNEQAIRNLHLKWIEAVNAGHLDRLLGWMADDVVFMGPGQSAFGRAEFSPTFLQAHQQNVIRCISELQEVIVANDLAFGRSTDSLKVVPRAGGPAADFAGDRLTVYRKQSDGRWLVARDAHTLVPVGTG